MLKLEPTIPKEPRRGAPFAVSDTQKLSIAPVTPSLPLGRAELDQLDERLFTSPFVLVRADNTALRGGVGSLEVARAHLQKDPDVATIVGTLVGDAWCVDVDPSDAGADPEAGEALADALRTWCEDHGAPVVVRASGRPGGRHVVARLPELLLSRFRCLVADQAEHHGVHATVRKSLRLLGAPHRLGLDAPLLSTTLLPDDLPEKPRRRRHDRAKPQVPASRRDRRRKRRGVATGDSRSEAEFGDACAWARAGWGPKRAWTAANQPGTKAAEMGETSWRRWVWCVAVTIAAAEEGVDEAEAWRRFAQASPQRGRHLGLECWRREYWHTAIAENGRTRRRRTRTRRAADATPPQTAEQQAADQQEQALISTALREAAAHAVAAAGRRPQFARSLEAVLDVLAEQIVRRGGSLSVRTWAELARTDTKTVRRARDFAAEHDVIHRARSYEDGAKDCDAWLPGPASTSRIASLRGETSPTRWYTTPPAPRGRATPADQQARHARERRLWRLRCELAEHVKATGERFADSQHPAARTLRSLHVQRTWWEQLSPAEQAARIALCQARLGAMHRTERRAWLAWLNHRARITNAAERHAAGTSWPSDVAVLTRAPHTVHLGRRDPRWRSGGTCPTEVRQYALAVA